MIVCSICKIEKNESLFNKRKSSKNGYNTVCRECTKERVKSYRDSDPERYRKDSRDSYNRNREIRLVYDRARKEKKAEYWQAWKINCIDKYTEHLIKNREKIDIRLKVNLSRRIRHALNGVSKSKKTVKYLGIDREGFKKYIESKMCYGMTWDNYGKGGWVLDHIIPCKMFDLSIEQEADKCFNYMNMRPLWDKENSIKSSRFDLDLVLRFGISKLLPYNYNFNKKEG